MSIILQAIAARLAPLILQIIESPAVERDAEKLAGVVAEYFMEIIDEELNKVSIFQKIKNKFKELFIMDENTTNAVQAIEQVAEVAAMSALDQKRNALLDKLNTELATTKSAWVRFRDTVYVTLLKEADDEFILDELASRIK